MCRLLFLLLARAHSLSCRVGNSVYVPEYVSEVTRMAFAILAEIPGLSREQYEIVVTRVNELGSPAGALFHAGGPVEGGYRTVEVWESQEAAESFYNSDILKRATASLPTELQQPKVLMTWPVDGVDAGSGWRRVN